jgi:hypothetical protein
MLPKGLEIEKKLQDKNIYFYTLKPKLQKLLNQQSSVVISSFTKQRLKMDLYFNFVVETLEKPDSHPLRERICRDDPMDYIKDLEREVNERRISQEEFNERLYRWSKIVYVLLKKLPWFLSRNYILIAFYHKYFKENIQKAASVEKKYELPSPEIQLSMEMFTLVLKILVTVVSNCEEQIPKEKMTIIFDLVDVVDLKIMYYTNFINKFFKITIPTKFSENQQKQIFMHYLQIYHYVETRRLSRVKDDKYYLRSLNYELILPLLSNVFSKEDVETSFILSNEVISEIHEIIKANNEEPDKPSGCILPGWLKMELTVMLDYLLCKIDFRNLREEKFAQTKTGIVDERSNTKISVINEFLHSLVLFAWKSIVRKQGSSKLLANMSKLLVSRIKNHSAILNEDDSMKYIYELFNSVIHMNEDVVDEETKQIWLNICDIILPEIKENSENDPVKANRWFEDYMKAMEINEPTGQRDLAAGGTTNRWWVAILRNRQLMYPYKKFILDQTNSTSFSFSYWIYIRNWLSMPKTPYLLYDVLLLYINWYMKDYKACVEAGQPTDRIANLNPDKETFFMNVFRELIKKDDDFNTGYLTRSHFLFRAFTLFIGKNNLDHDAFIKLVNNYKKKGQNVLSANEPNPMLVKRRLKTNFVMMNICLVILYHPKIKADIGDVIKEAKERELINLIFEFVIKEMPQKQSKEYMKYPYLVSLAYHIIKRILAVLDRDNRDIMLEKIFTIANESNRVIFGNRDAARAAPDTDCLSLWLAVLLYRFIYDYKPELLESQIETYIQLSKLFCDYLKNKKFSKEVQAQEEAVQYDENEDILERFFVCYNVDSQDPKYIYKGYYKGYCVLAMRILMKFIEKDCLPFFDQLTKEGAQVQSSKTQTMKTDIPAVFLEVASDLLSNLLHSEIDIKLEILVLIRCLLLPGSVKNPVYKRLSADKDFLSTDHKIGILNTLKIDQLLKKNEGGRPVNKIFLSHLWQLVVDFVEYFIVT